MKQMILVCCALLLFSSCRKDSRKYTSDFPDQFWTNIEIYHYELQNKTSVYAYFTYMPSTWETWYLELPEGSDVKANGVKVNFDPEQYPLELEGKPDCLIEFTNFDGLVYSNTITPPDSAYFINLPDTVSSTDIQIQVNPHNLSNYEGSRFCIDSHGDDYGCDYLVDSTGMVDITHGLTKGNSHVLHLYRYKTLVNPVLPGNRGNITYNYVTQRTIFCQ